MRLEVVDATFGYTEDEENAMQSHISLSVESGQICCVLGPNGCGKTTLFRCILGLHKMFSGRVLIDGSDIARWDARKLSNAMAYVSQEHVQPFPYRVKEIVLLGRLSKVGYTGQPGDEDYRIAEEAMRDMGIYELRDETYTDISGGELQLTMIARALAQEPQILILDEPTSALDYGNVVRVIKKVKSLAERGYGILMTTHSPDHAFMCHSDVLLLQKGFPMKYGSAVDIITEKNMKQAFGINMKIVEFVNSRDEVVRMCAPSF